MTKIDIISGFLGAGKTTLIKKLLKESFGGEKVVLIENEYGEVGIDGGFLKNSGIEITEMNSGCICCTLVGDFITSIQEILVRFAPDRIIIEPSGVGKLSDVMAAVIDLEKTEDIKLNGLVTVVNTLTFQEQKKSFGEFFTNQVEHATTVIMSRTGNIDSEKINLCMQMIQETNPNASVISTPWENISGDKILSVIEGKDNLAVKTLAVKNHEIEKHEHDNSHHEHHHNDEHDCCHNHKDKHEEHHHHEHHHNDEHEGHHHTHHHHKGHGCCHNHEGEHTHHADEIFDTWGIETAIEFDKSHVENLLSDFSSDDSEYGNILRAKGIVNSTEGWIYFDYVEGEWEVRSGEPDYSGRIVVIGTDLNKNALKNAISK